MKRINIWMQEEYRWPMTFGFVPNLVEYPIEDGTVHPCMIVVPGGGYTLAAPSEGEVVARRFNTLGYHCFVLTYTTNPLGLTPLLEQPMRDLARAIRLVRAKAREMFIDPRRIYVCGFSAAAHLCACLCTYYSELRDDSSEYEEIPCRPDGAVLCYPVITAGPFAHQDSFRKLLGVDIYERDDEESLRLLDRFSMEKHVHRNMPPCFLWQTATDELVPVENSYLFAAALYEHGVRYAHHVFSSGRHGLSTADEAWARGDFGEPYPTEQLQAVINAIRCGDLQQPEEMYEWLCSLRDPVEKNHDVPYREVEVWPILADCFLKQAHNA